jgi:hypothetical protein
MASSRWITLLLSLTIGGAGKIKYLSEMLKNLRREPDFQSFVKKEINYVPAFMIENVRKDLGQMWNWLPNKTLTYNPNVISHSTL